MSNGPHRLHLALPLRRVRLSTRADSTPAPRPKELTAQTEEAIYERGRRDGATRLNEQLLRQRQEMIELQQGVIRSLQQAVPRVIRDCEKGLTALTLELAQKIVAGLPVSAEMVEASLREALQQVEETTDYHLHLHPDDLELLRKHSSPLLAPQAGTQRFHFHPTTEISRGGCMLKTRFGVVDGQRESKVEALKKSLLS